MGDIKIKIRKIKANSWLVSGRHINSQEVCAPIGSFRSWQECIDWLKKWGWI